MKENKRKTLLLSMFGKGMKREKREEKRKKEDLFCLICKGKINGKKYIYIYIYYFYTLRKKRDEFKVMTKSVI